MATGQVANPGLVAVLRELWPAADWSAAGALGAGQNCSFTLDAAGLHPRRSGGARPTVRVDAEPARVLEALGARQEVFPRWAGDQLIACGMAAPLARATAERLGPALLAVLRQADRAQVWVLAPEASGAGFDAELRLTPARESWLEQVVQGIGRDATRVPVGRGDPHAVTLRVGALRPNLVALLRSWSTEVFGPGAEVSGLLGGGDFTPEIAWTFDGALTSIARVTGRAEVERTLQGLAASRPEAASSPGSFEHRGVRSVTQRLAVPGLGVASVSYHALVAEWLLMGSEPQRLRGLIDDALEGRVRATPLPDGALVELTLPVAAPLRGGALPLPARLQVMLLRDAGALVVRVREG